MKLDQGASANELSVYSFASTHLVIDIVGYYINSEATPLDCVDTTAVAVTVAAGATSNAVASACPGTYSQTATNCESSTWQMSFVFFKGGVCSAQNNSAASRPCGRRGPAAASRVADPDIFPPDSTPAKPGWNFLYSSVPSRWPRRSTAPPEAPSAITQW